MRLDLRQLEVFCHVYEHGSFSRAAEQLLLSQPTVSEHIKNLEALLGVRLFDRLPRGIRPTAEARVLYDHGRCIIDRRDRALEDLKGLMNRYEGWLHVSASTIPGEYLLPNLIASFSKKYPDIRVAVQVQDSRAVCESVAEGHTELGFVGAVFDMEPLEFQRFASDELVLAAPDQPPYDEMDSITVEDLKSHPHVLREQGSGTRRAFEEAIGQSLDTFPAVAVLGSTNAVKEALKAGLGLSVVSKRAIQAELSAGTLKTLPLTTRPPLTRNFHTVRNRTLTMSQLAKVFLECVVETSSSSCA